MASFFDDFAAIGKRIFVDSASVTFSECFPHGIKLEEAKSEDGPTVTFLGLRTSFPSHSSRFELSDRLGEITRTDWLALFGHFLKTKPTTHQELEKLIGRLSFPREISSG